MLTGIPRRLSYANVIATGAMFVALGGGAYALSGIPDRGGVFHGCVSNATGVLRVVKIASSCHKARGRGKHRNPGEFAVRWSQQGPRGLQGIQGVQGVQGVGGTNGVNGADGTARAYGLVSQAGTSVTRSKNITGVTNPLVGRFCITLAAGIDPATTGAVVTPNIDNDDTDIGDNAAQASAEWRPSANVCPAGTLEVVTYSRTETTAADPQGGATFVTNVKNTLANEGFFIV